MSSQINFSFSDNCTDSFVPFMPTLMSDVCYDPTLPSCCIVRDSLYLDLDLSEEMEGNLHAVVRGCAATSSVKTSQKLSTFQQDCNFSSSCFQDLYQPRRERIVQQELLHDLSKPFFPDLDLSEEMEGDLKETEGEETMDDDETMEEEVDLSMEESLKEGPKPDREVFMLMLRVLLPKAVPYYQ